MQNCIISNAHGESSLCIGTVKGNLTDGGGRPAGGALTPYYSVSTADPTGRDGTCKSLTTLALLYQQVKVFLPPQQQPSQWETVTTQPMRSHYTLNSHFVYDNSPNSSLSSIKECSSPLFSRLAYGFAMACLSWIEILFLNKLIFAGKVTLLF